MTVTAGALEARLIEAIDGGASPAAVIAGPCGSGRTALLLRLRERLGPGRCQYVDVQRVATTPERFLRALVSSSPFALDGVTLDRAPASPRSAFDATLQFLQAAHAPGGAPAIFLLDEALELRTFESFPGLRGAMSALVAALADSPNRFVMTTQFRARARRLSAEAPGRLDVHDMPQLTAPDVQGLLAETLAGTRASGVAEDIAQAVRALAVGHVGYAQILAGEMRAAGPAGVTDPVSALAALLAPGGRLDAACRFCYEFRLHRARGYGALKAILDVLAQEEPLTLTAIAQRLQRTPGSTKDYLSWLEDVDLVQVARKQYRFGDPLLRLWVRLNGRAVPPAEDDVAREVHRYAAERLAVPAEEPAPVLAGSRPAGRADIIEFD
jgi:hypothetical protein